MEIPWSWVVLRSAGVVAMALLTLSVAAGLVGPRLGPSWRLGTITVHRGSAVAGSALVAGHVVLGVLDGWIDLDWVAAVVPGTSGWQRWGMALGTLGVDLLVALLVTTAVRLRHPSAWRRVHWVAYPVWALAVGHALLVGTDAQLVRRMAAACAGVVLAALAVRLLGSSRTARAQVLPGTGAP